MKFAIIGAGGVGGFFGGKLAQCGEDVWFVARGPHLAAMQRTGLHINSTEGKYMIPPGKMTANLEEIGHADVVLFCVKSYDTETAAQQLTPVLSKSTIVISLQNGVDNEEKIQRSISAGAVYGGVAYIYSTITAPGEVTETGGPKKLMFGSLNAERPGNDRRGKDILEVMRRAGIRAELTGDIFTALWKKFIFITGAAGITTLTRLTLGEILSVNETRSMLADAMRETEAVAKIKGAAIEPGYLDRVFETLKNFDNSTRSSLYYDLTHDKPMEIEALSGTVVRYGLALGIPTPIHRTIYAALLPYHLKHTQRISGP